MTTDPDPEADAAIAEALRIVTEARQVDPRRYVCISCTRLYTRAQVVATDPALCRGCKALWEQRR
jgi:hypothetical protein